MKIAGGIKIANQMTMRWGDYPGLSEWVQCDHMGGRKSELERVVGRCRTAVFENRRRGHRPRNAGSHQSWKRQGNILF